MQRLSIEQICSGTGQLNRFLWCINDVQYLLARHWEPDKVSDLKATTEVIINFDVTLLKRLANDI